MNWFAPRSRSRAGRCAVHFIRLPVWGSSILVQTDRHNILLDIAHSTGIDAVVNYLHRVGVSRLDLLILTHPHMDHIGAARGIQDILSAFDVAQVWSTGHPYPVWYDGTTQFPPDATSYEAYGLVLNQLFPNGYTVAAENGQLPRVSGECITTYHEPIAGETAAFGDLTLEVLHPTAILTQNLNSDSIVIRATFGNVAFMLCADGSYWVTELTILANFPDVKADVLYLGHHGMGTTGAEWLDAVQPNFAVVQSAGRDIDQPIKDRLAARSIPYYNVCLDYSHTLIVDTDGVTYEAIPDNDYFGYAWQAPKAWHSPALG